MPDGPILYPLPVPKGRSTGWWPVPHFAIPAASSQSFCAKVVTTSPAPLPTPVAAPTPSSCGWAPTASPPCWRGRRRVSLPQLGSRSRAATRVRGRASGRSASRSPQVVRRISHSRSMRPRVHQTRALRPGRGRKNGVPLLIALLRLAAHPCRTTGTVGVLPALGIPTIHVSAAGGGIPPP